MAERKSEGRALLCMSLTTAMTKSTAALSRYSAARVHEPWRFVYTSGCCRTALVGC